MSSSEDTHTKEDNIPYTPQQVKVVRVLYFIAAVFWIWLLIWIGIFKLPDKNGLFKVILIIPLIVFLIAFICAPKLHNKLEGTVIRLNYISVGLVILFPILTWMYNNSNCSGKSVLLTLSIAGLAFSLLSMFDLWLPDKWIFFLKHWKSICQTLSLGLILASLYFFYSLCYTPNK